MIPTVMRPTTIRFAPDAMELVNAAASKLGISVSQFVREAAVMRAMFVDGQARDDLKSLSERVSTLSRRED